MKIEVSLIHGLNIGIEYVDGEDIDGDDADSLVIVDLLFVRFFIFGKRHA